MLRYMRRCHPLSACQICKALKMLNAEETTTMCREAFVAPAGRVLLSADYAQMELRLMAHMSGDARLIATLSDPAQDPFKHWAAQWLRIPPHSVRGRTFLCLYIVKFYQLAIPLPCCFEHPPRVSILIRAPVPVTSEHAGTMPAVLIHALQALADLQRTDRRLLYDPKA